MSNFEDFLMEEHAEQYIGTKDCMIDDFNSWIQNLSIDDWIKLGDKYCLRELESVKGVIGIRIDRLKAELQKT